jgi:hypothetical protein
MADICECCEHNPGFDDDVDETADNLCPVKDIPSIRTSDTCSMYIEDPIRALELAGQCRLVA